MLRLPMASTRRRMSRAAQLSVKQAQDEKDLEGMSTDDVVRELEKLRGGERISMFLAGNREVVVEMLLEERLRAAKASGRPASLRSAAAATPSPSAAAPSRQAMPPLQNAISPGALKAHTHPSHHTHPPRTLIDVTVVEGRDMTKMDFHGLSDPYVKVKFGKKERHVSAVIKKNLNPVWNFKSTLGAVEHVSAGGGVTFSVWDWDLVGRGDKVRLCEVCCGAIDWARALTRSPTRTVTRMPHEDVHTLTHKCCAMPLNEEYTTPMRGVHHVQLVRR